MKAFEALLLSDGLRGSAEMPMRSPGGTRRRKDPDDQVLAEQNLATCESPTLIAALAAAGRLSRRRPQWKG